MKTKNGFLVVTDNILLSSPVADKTNMQYSDCFLTFWQLCREFYKNAVVLAREKNSEVKNFSFVNVILAVSLCHCPAVWNGNVGISGCLTNRMDYDCVANNQNNKMINK